MIDVKIIRKAKAKAGATAIYAAIAGGSSGTSKEADHAAKADVANKAEYAEKAAYAEKAGAADVVLTRPIDSTIDVGHLPKGSNLPEGMSLEEIFRQILYKPKGPEFMAELSESNVEVGTPKTSIRYTAERNSAGPLASVILEDGTDIIGNFVEDNGTYTYTRNLATDTDPNWVEDAEYTAKAVFRETSEDGETISEKSLTAKNKISVYRKWFAAEGYMTTINRGTSEQVRALKHSGLLMGNSITVVLGEWNSFFLALPSDDTRVFDNVYLHKRPGDNIKGKVKQDSSVSVYGATPNKDERKYTIYKIETQGRNDPDSITLIIK